MQQEIRFATFNVCNLAAPGTVCYEDQAPYSEEEYATKVAWVAEYLDKLDADVIGFQEIFSQSALLDAMARTTRYRNAALVGFESESDERATPRLALISRLPLASSVVQYTEFPQELNLDLPGGGSLNRFSRPILHAQIVLPDHTITHVFVCHLKSKRPDYHDRSSDGGNIDDADLGSLRSLYRRGAEALSIRRLVSACLHKYRAPVVVMGDFNDTAGAVSTQLAMGGPWHDGDELNTRLYDCYRIQDRRDTLRDVGFTHLHNDSFETVDHVLVSEHFNPASPSAIGNVSSVVYLNDHVALASPEATDHGLVLVRIKLHAPDDAG